MTPTHRLVAALLAVTTAACGSPTVSDRVRALGEIAGYNSDDPKIDVRQSGRTVEVEVVTYGGGCHEAGETEVLVDGLTATISPYDYTAYPGTSCTRELRTFVHRATVQFAAAGAARVRVRGLDVRTRTAANMTGDTLVV
jgi:hypothetical protein